MFLAKKVENYPKQYFVGGSEAGAHAGEFFIFDENFRPGNFPRWGTLYAWRERSATSSGITNSIWTAFEYEKWYVFRMWRMIFSTRYGRCFVFFPLKNRFFC